MTKFKEYILINEGRMGSKLSYDEFTELKDKNCSDIVKYYKNGGEKIYRGSRHDKGDYVLMDTSEFEERISANTMNYYTLIINNTWGKEWPKRNLICTTSIQKAKNYGDVYLILPYNGTKIGICSKHDIWDSFKNIPKNKDAEDLISELMYTFYEIMGRALDDKDFGKFKKDLKEYDKMVNKSDLRSFWKDIYTGNMFEDLKKVFGSDGFKLVKAGDKLLSGKEIWMDGKILMIKREGERNYFKYYKRMTKLENEI